MKLYVIDYLFEGLQAMWQGVADNKKDAIEKSGVKYNQIVNIEVIMDYFKVTYLQKGLYAYWIGLAYDKDHAIEKANVSSEDIISVELFDEIDSTPSKESIKKLN